MKRFLIALIIIVGLQSIVLAQQGAQEKRLLLLPFREINERGDVVMNATLAGIVSAQLQKMENVAVADGKAMEALVKPKKVNIPRIARVIRRQDLDGVVWGEWKILSEDKYSMTLYVLHRKNLRKPRSYSGSAKDMEELVAALINLTDRMSVDLLGKPKIGRIIIKGNQRVRDEAIMNRMALSPGAILQPSEVSHEIKEIFAMGYFEDVSVNAQPRGNDKVDLVFEVKELPHIKTIEIKGNSVFTQDEILDEITTRSLSVARGEKIQKDIGKIRGMYERKGYYTPKIEWGLEELSDNQAKLVFTIDEGEKRYLTDIRFPGREKLTEKELLKILTIKEKSWFWWIDHSGKFTRSDLDENRNRIIGYYSEKGYVQAQVGEPSVDIEDEGVVVSYPVNEGDRFQIRKVELEGDLILSEEELKERLKNKPKTWFKGSDVGKDTETLTKMYKNLGYAYVDVEPMPKLNEEHNFVDLTFRITKNQRVKIGQVQIRGNDRTRDKIIRRNVLLAAGDRYQDAALDATKERLEALDFFEAVKIKTSPGSQPDIMDMTVEVMEKKTGTIAAGLGFSNKGGAMGNIDVKEKNVLGMGIMLNGNGKLSANSNTYEGSITYPWLFDWPLNATLSAYNNNMTEANYTKVGTGVSLNLGFPVYGNWRMHTGVSRDASRKVGLQRSYSDAIAKYYKARGEDPDRFYSTAEHALSMSLIRDTRLGSMIPRGGSKITFGSRFAGLGGDVSYARYYSDASYYYPLFWKAIMKARLNFTGVSEVGNMPVPVDRRILLGGISTVRGYKYGDLAPKGEYGAVLGGDRGVFANLECLFPIFESAKLFGVVFTDAGNAWNSTDSLIMEEVKAGGGVGLRWVSPMGPIRVEYGWKLTPEKGDTSGEFAFTMGQLF
jgi:outer membrane protein insertion porin family